MEKILHNRHDARTAHAVLPEEENLLEAGCGWSREPDARAAGAAAARQALNSIRRNPLSALMVFASVSYDLAALLEGIADTAGDGIPLIGSTTAGEICGAPLGGSVVVTALASPVLTVRTAVGRDVSKGWARSLDECASSPSLSGYFHGYGEVSGGMEADGRSVFAMMFSPGNTKSADSMTYEILDLFNERTGGAYPLIGSCSADEWNMETNYVLHGREVCADSLLIAFFETSLRFGMGMDHGFMPTKNSFSVGQREGHEVLELNGRPAVDVVAEAAGFSRGIVDGEHITLSTTLPFGSLTPLGNYTISIASYSTPRGGIRFSQPHGEGTILNMMTHRSGYLVNAGRHALRRALLRGGITRPAAVFMFPCALRSRIGDYSADDEIENVKTLVPGVPVTGFYGFGEQTMLDDGITRHNNGTVAVLALGSEMTQMAKAARARQVYGRILEIQHDTARRLSLAESVEDAFGVLMNSVCSTGEFDSGGAYLYREDEKVLQLVYHFGFSDGFIRATGCYGEETRSMDLVRAGRPVYIDYRSILTDADGRLELFKDEKLKSLSAIPLLHEGKVIGSLNMASHTVESTGGLVRGMLETMAPHVASILQKILSHEQIRLAGNNLEMLYNTINDFIFIVDSDGRVIDANRTVENRLGYGRPEITSMRVVDFHPPERRDEAAGIIRDMLSGMRNFCEIPLMAKNGGLIPVETRIVKGTWYGRDVLFGVSRDMTERLRMEEKLRKSKRDYDELAATVPVGIFKLTMLKSGEPAFTYLSPRWSEITGLSMDDVMRDPFIAINQVHPDVIEEFLKLNYDAYAKRTPFTWEGPFIIRGEKRYLHIESRPVPRETGEDAWEGIQYDVTDRFMMEERLRESLDEKEALLREVNHRVKNNMQLIASLISLQMNNLGEAGRAGVLEDLRNRVQTMAAVHEILYHDGSEGRVKLADYVRRITAAIMGTGAVQGCMVDVIQEIDENLALRPEKAVPCGLILNELVTNSMKYAFAGRAKGAMRIGARAEADGIRIEYSDDGPGLPPDLDLDTPRSMGMFLVKTLARQLKGRLAVQNNGGVSISLAIPE